MKRKNKVYLKVCIKMYIRSCFEISSTDYAPFQPFIMTQILITNDDGIQSPGIMALWQALRRLGQTVVVAPEQDNSAVSHSLTMNRPLLVKESGPDCYTVDGTPTDCVAIALAKLLPNKPDLLVSGINAGPNLGDDISYSGTVSAAVEGTMYSVPSMAISLNGDASADFSHAAAIAARIADRILHQGLPDNTLMNVNVPAATPKGVRLTRQGRRLWENSIQEIFDPQGRKHFWIGGGTPLKDTNTDTDVHALQEGYISITPIHLDLTNHEGMHFIRDHWQLDDISP